MTQTQAVAPLAGAGDGQGMDVRFVAGESYEAAVRGHRLVVDQSADAGAGEDSLAGYLHQAGDLLAARPDHIDHGPTGLPDAFKALRWFPLPPACLAGAGPLGDGVQ
jgi:hypothetical protein